MQATLLYQPRGALTDEIDILIPVALIGSKLSENPADSLLSIR